LRGSDGDFFGETVFSTTPRHTITGERPVCGVLIEASATTGYAVVETAGHAVADWEWETDMWWPRQAVSGTW
jgi:hypothetical protein